ncbi:hypothetical protein [Erythrobacter sp. SG61-1L]|uniref:hypothetical protein n=1 Tax=Erythrobacter sp. SG61-1L TaxID=1603897 RepID=UPI0006C92F95|nr:hypothetical protein [Erythrobacter sp. SG61-1L]
MSAQDFLPYLGWIVGGAFVVSLAGIWGWMHTTKLRIQHGYPLEGMWGQSLKPELNSEAMQRVRLLTQENASLRAELASVKDRMAVVERIVTDKGFDLARQIESLREPEPAPLPDATREKSVN